MKSLCSSISGLGLLLALTLCVVSCGGASHGMTAKESAGKEPAGVSPQARAINDQAYELIKQKKAKEALPKAQEAVRLAPAFGEAQKNLALSLSMLRRYDEALPPAREAVRLQPDFDKAHNVLGKILYGLGQYRESIGEYKEAIRLNENYALAYFNLGLAHDKLGDTGAAIKAAERAVKLDPAEKYYRTWLDGVMRYAEQPGRTAARLAPPQVDAAKDVDAYYNYGAQVRDYLYHEQYALLDATADAVRTSKERLPGGVWKLYQLYQGLRTPEDGREAPDGAWQYHLGKLSKWVERNPASATARIGLAYAYVEYGWQARGGGYMHSVTREGYARYVERIARAATILREDAKLSAACPQWYAVMQQVALGQGWDMADYNKLFEAGVEFEPLYYPLYEQKALYLMPRWHGRPGDWERFADTMALTVGGKEGSIIFNKIVTTMSKADMQELRGGQFWARSKSLWPRTKEGYDNLTKLYGASAHGANHFCLLAVLAGDRAVGIRMFDEIGENWDDNVWRTKTEFEMYRRWSHDKL